MIVLGLLLLAGVVVVSVLAIARGGDDVSIDIGSLEIKTDAAGMFLAGAITLLVAVLGLWLVRRGLRRSRRRRQEIQELRARAARHDAERREADDTVVDHDTAVTDTEPTSVHEPEATHIRTYPDEHVDTGPREG